MRRYILRQYMHGEPCHDPANVTGTFDELKKAQAFAAMCLREFNEIIDQNSWEVVWRFNKNASAGSMASGASPLHATLALLDRKSPAAWFN
jgi:hypothetical protein